MGDPHLHPQSRLRNVVPFLPALIWAAIVVALSLAPGSSVGRLSFLNLPYADKLAHLAFYAILAILLLLGFVKSRHRSHKNETWMAIIICVMLGLILEVLQPLLGNQRHFEVLDIIANIIGTLGGSALFNLLLKTKNYGS